MEPYPVALLGFGNVGRAFARLLLKKRAELHQRYGLDVRVVGIMTGRHGAAIDPGGIDLEKACDLAEHGSSLAELSRQSQPPDNLAFIRSCGGRALFENTPVDYATGQPAVTHLQATLETGMHAITANKGPVVHAYRRLRELAARQGLRFLFEATVMDGAPVFSLWREALPAAQLSAFQGILNSTTNLILTLMEDGLTFEEALDQAQIVGIAETDPSGDLEGWDAAVKVAALTTVLMDQPLDPSRIQRQGITELTREDLAEAHRQGARWKLLCQAERTSGGVRASVRPALVYANDPLYHVSGTSSAITFQSDVLGDLTLLETDPGPETTAYGLLADFLRAARPERFTA